MHTTQFLTPAQLRDLERELHAERARLERSIAASDAANGVGDEHAPAMPGADDGDDVAVHLRVRERHQAVRGALRRLADGVYGLCTGCQEPIPFGRLLVMPEGERCVACGGVA